MKFSILLQVEAEKGVAYFTKKSKIEIQTFSLEEIYRVYRKNWKRQISI